MTTPDAPRWSRGRAQRTSGSRPYRPHRPYRPYGSLYSFVGPLLLGALMQQAGGSPPEMAALLSALYLDDHDLAAIELGEVVTKLPRTDDAREVAVFGVVRVRVPPEFFVNEFRDIETFRKGERVPQLGMFSVPPRPSDLRELVIPQGDLEALSWCEVGACDVKLSAMHIQRFRRDVEWSAADYREQAAELSRAMLLEQMKAYLEGGDAALGAYADKPEPLSIAEGFRIVLNNSRVLLESVPNLHRYLAEFPKPEPEGVESFFYWTEESFGLKPVITLNHAAIYGYPKGTTPRFLIVGKQLYGTHYFQAALGLISVIDGSSGGKEPLSYVLFANRMRFDGRLSGVKRRIFKLRMRDGLDKDLTASRDRLEEAYHARQ